MSGVIALAAVGDLTDTLFAKFRAIGVIEPDVTIEEHHVDELIITQHPVEIGAAITDHTFKAPAQLTVQYGWSDASLNAALTGVANVIGSQSLTSLLDSYSSQVYYQLRQLQVSGVLQTVYTGKRVYQNMLIQSVATQTSRETEYALIAEIRLQQVIVTRTLASTLPPAQVHAFPEMTAPVQQGGLQDPVAPKTQPNISMLGFTLGTYR